MKESANTIATIMENVIMELVSAMKVSTVSIVNQDHVTRTAIIRVNAVMEYASAIKVLQVKIAESDM
jgi:hypothetical protein